MSAASVPSRDGRPRQTIAEVQTRLAREGEQAARAAEAARRDKRRRGYELLHAHEVLKRFESHQADT